MHVSVATGLPRVEADATRLEQEAWCREVVFIAVSGYGQEQDRTRSRAAGFDHRLAMPVDFDSLWTLLSASR